jgi:hypothetical protein
MNNLRQSSLSFTAKKYAYRQSRDGFLLTLLLNPAEDLDRIAVADLGTPYGVAMHEIDDNDQPISQGAANSLAPGSEPLTARVAAVQRSGWLCKDVRFQKFLKEEFAGGWKLFSGRADTGSDEHCAIQFVRWRCGVQSRAEIKTNDDAYTRWQELDAGYQAWLQT